MPNASIISGPRGQGLGVSISLYGLSAVTILDYIYIPSPNFGASNGKVAVYGNPSSCPSTYVEVVGSPGVVTNIRIVFRTRKSDSTCSEYSYSDANLANRWIAIVRRFNASNRELAIFVNGEKKYVATIPSGEQSILEYDVGSSYWMSPSGTSAIVYYGALLIYNQSIPDTNVVDISLAPDVPIIKSGIMVWLLWEGIDYYTRRWISMPGGTLQASIDAVSTAIRVREIPPRAPVFNGLSSYVEIPHSDSLMPSQVTVVAWIYPKAYGDSWARILEKGGNIIGGGYGLEFNPGGNRKQRFVIWNGTSAQVIDSNTVIPLNTWTFVAGTFDGSTMKLYINGVLEASGTAIMTSNTAVMTIGRAAAGNSSLFTGYIAQILVYNRALSDWEIRQLYLNPMEPVRNGLVLWLSWDSFDTSSNTWYDKSGSGNNGVGYNVFIDEERFNKSLYFDGNGYCVIEPFSMYGWSEFTIEEWILPVYPKSNTSWSKFSMIGDDWTDYPSTFFDTDNRTDYTWLYVYFRTRKSDGSKISYLADIYSYRNNWIQVVRRFTSAREYSVWVNGVKIYTATITSDEQTILSWNPDSATYPYMYRRFVLGSNTIGTEGMTYYQSVLRIWNRALSDDEIKNLYIHPSSPPSNGLVVRLEPDSIDFNNGVWRDLSGNNNHAYIYNAILAASTIPKQRFFKQYMSFDGVDDYTSIPLEVYGWNEITVSTWFYPVWLTPIVGYYKTLQFGDEWVDYPDFHFSTGANQDLGFLFLTRKQDGTRGNYWKWFPMSQIGNRWNHYVLRFTRDRKLSHWLNCSKVYETTIPSNEYTVLEWNPNTATYPERYRRLVLGANSQFTEQLNVFHAVVTVHNVALSDADIQRMCVDPDYVPSNGLVVWLAPDSMRFTQWLDKSGNNRHGVVYGATPKHEWFERAVYFDGSDDYVSIPHSTLLDLTSSLTIAGWFYRERTAVEWLLNKNYDSASNTQYGLLLNNNNIEFWLNGASRASYTADINGRWVFLAGRWNGSTASLFVNNEQVASAQYTTALTSQPYPLTIGCRKTAGGNPGADWYRGLAGHVYVYNRAISDSELSQLYNQPFNPPRNGLVLWLAPESFNRSTLTWIDRSGSNSHGTTTVTGSAQYDGKPFRKAVFFNGVNAYAYVEPFTVYGWSEITVSIWFYFVHQKANTSWSKTCMIGDYWNDYPSAFYGTDNRTDYTWFYFVFTTRKPDGRRGDYSPAVSASSIVNRWNHYVLRFTSNRVVSHWLNGSKIYEATVPADEKTILEWNPDTATYPSRYRRFVLGANTDLGEHMTVYYYTVRIWNRALSDWEIQMLSRNPEYTPRNGLMLYLHPDGVDLSKNVWYDWSDNGRNAVMSNARVIRLY